MADQTRVPALTESRDAPGATGREHDPSIEVRRLTRRFGSFVAVDAISFSVPAGSIFGLLGANGAGKSTTIRMLCGLMAPSSGTAVVGGIDVAKDPEGVKRRIGYMSQRFSLYDDLTVEENIRFFGGVYGLDSRALGRRLEETVGMAGLGGKERTLARELSGGWKQRLALGCALLHSPGIVFLDEPTGGTDPLSRRAFWDVINGLSSRGTTVLVTTHYLDEAEYCNTMVLMHAGRIVAQGSPRELKEHAVSGAVFEVECADAVRGMAALRGEPSAVETAMFGTLLHVTVEREEDLPLVLLALERAGVAARRSSRIVPSLEDVFIRLIDRHDKGARP